MRRILEYSIELFEGVSRNHPSRFTRRPSTRYFVYTYFVHHRISTSRKWFATRSGHSNRRNWRKKQRGWVYFWLWHCMLNADSTKTHSSSVTFHFFCRLYVEVKEQSLFHFYTVQSKPVWKFLPLKCNFTVFRICCGYVDNNKVKITISLFPIILWFFKFWFIF